MDVQESIEDVDLMGRRDRPNYEKTPIVQHFCISQYKTTAVSGKACLYGENAPVDVFIKNLLTSCHFELLAHLSVITASDKPCLWQCPTFPKHTITVVMLREDAFTAWSDTKSPRCPRQLIHATSPR
jgi:hypothetical protein